MPPKSARQMRAMQSASHGKSTLGISSMIGKEFVGKSKKKKKNGLSFYKKGY